MLSKLSTLLTLVISATTVLAGTKDHFVLSTAGTLAVMRMDPIVNPGGISAHLHTIVGGSLFGPNLGEPGDLTKSDCSTIIIGDDKSNYWAPSLMYKYENGSLSNILHRTRIYYFMKTDKVQPFPPGLRMISGNSMHRNASDWMTKGVMWSCNHGEQAKELPTQTGAGSCHSVEAGIYFPSCGLADGSLDSENHFDHMTWPLDSPAGPTPNGHKCPDSHPIKYPTIFMEISYYFTDEQKWRNDPNLLVLSNGDAVGSSYHADFHNGWVPETLKAAIEQCGVGKSVGDDLQSCPPLAKTFQPEALHECRLQGDIVDEDVGLVRPIDKLPGCNTLWTSAMGDERPKCVETDKPGLVKPTVFFNNLRYWLSIPIVAPKDAGEPEDNGILSLRPSLGYVGASTLRQWIWGDDNVRQPASDGVVIPVVSAAAASSAASAAQSSMAAAAGSAASELVNKVAIVEFKSSVASSSTAAPTSSSARLPTFSSPAIVNGNAAAVETSEAQSSSASPISTVISSTASAPTTPANASIKKPKTCSKRRKRNGLAQYRKRSNSVRRH